MERTFNQILQTLGQFASTHPQVNSSGTGFKTDINEFLKNNQELAFLFFEPLSIQARENTLVYRMRIYCMDFKQKDNSNSKDVLSDTAQILVDLRKWLISNFELNNLWSIQFASNSLLPVNNWTADYCVGWYMDIDVETGLIESDCDIPGPPFLCPPVKFYINETLVGESATTFFINVVNQDGVATGSLVDGEWVVQTGGGECFPISLINTAGLEISNIESCPETGEFTLPDITLLDASGAPEVPQGVIGSTPIPLTIFIDGTVASYNYDAGLLTITPESAPVCFPIRLENGIGCILDTINTCPENGEYLLPTTTINNSNGSSTSIQKTNVINFTNSVVSSIDYSNSCTLNITFQTVFPILLTNGQGYLVDVIADAPFGGSLINLPEIDIYEGASPTPFASIPIPAILRIFNGTIQSIVKPGTAEEVRILLNSPFPINIVNENDCILAEIDENPLGEFRMPDIPLSDQSGAVGLTQAPGSILIENADILTTASTPDGCGLVINVNVPTPVSDGVHLIQANQANMMDTIYSSNVPNLYRIPNSIDNVYMTAAGARHILAIRNFVPGTGGELWVWGVNTTGAIGGSPDYQWTQIGVDTDWTHVAAGGNASMAIKAGALYGAGAGTSFIFGNNSTGNLSTFTQIGVDTDWEFVFIGDGFSAGIKGGDLVTCGFNGNYRTGLNTNVGTTQVWTVANNTETWSNVNCGRLHAAAVTTDGKLFTWGSNNIGRTGQGTTVGETQIPTQVGTDTDWVMCSASNQNTYATKTNGTAWGCGSGNGSIWGNFGLSPNVMTQDATLATDWVWLMTGSGNSVVGVKTNGTLYGAGLVFGNGLPTNENTLTQVGTETNNEIRFYGHSSGFSTELPIIRS